MGAEIALARALIVVRERAELSEPISSEQFRAMLAENEIDDTSAQSVMPSPER